MSCNESPRYYRLLDVNAGWDIKSIDAPADGSATVEGIDDSHGLRLGPPKRMGVDPESLSKYIPPRWFTPGLRHGEWFVLDERIEHGDNARNARLWFQSHNESKWVDVLPRLARGSDLENPHAIAVDARHLALADRRAGRVYVWTFSDGLLVCRIDIARPSAVAFAPWGELLIALEPLTSGLSDKIKVCRYSMAGARRRPTFLLSGGPEHSVLRMSRTIDGAVAAAVGPLKDGSFTIWKLCLNEQRPTSAEQSLTCCPSNVTSTRELTHGQLAHCMSPTNLSRVGENSFCIDSTKTDGTSSHHCFDRNGNVVETESPPEAAITALIHFKPIDSGIPRCRWHRIRLDADLPSGTMVQLRVRTSESRAASEDESDQWITGTDALMVQQPPGRFLHLELNLSGTGRSTPRVRQIQIVYPRVTSMDLLPAVYRDNPVAEDFTERFISLFDAAGDDLDDVINGFANLLDVEHVDASLLPWLAQLLGQVLEQDWSPDRRRRVIRSLPELYRLRGTIAGLTKAIQLILDVKPMIEESFRHRVWGSVGISARVGSVRLYSRRRSRFHLDRSLLGDARIESFGNPDRDPFRQTAYRFTVLVPASISLDTQSRRRLEKLVEAQKPAHALHQVRFPRDGFVVGEARVEIDTRLRWPEAPSLGNRNVGDARGNGAQLDHKSILHRGRKTSGGLRVGKLIIGSPQVVME